MPDGFDFGQQNPMYGYQHFLTGTNFQPSPMASFFPQMSQQAPLGTTPNTFQTLLQMSNQRYETQQRMLSNNPYAINAVNSFMQRGLGFTKRQANMMTMQNGSPTMLGALASRAFNVAFPFIGDPAGHAMISSELPQFFGGYNFGQGGGTQGARGMGFGLRQQETKSLQEFFKPSFSGRFQGGGAQTRLDVRQAYDTMKMGAGQGLFAGVSRGDSQGLGGQIESRAKEFVELIDISSGLLETFTKEDTFNKLMEITRGNVAVNQRTQLEKAARDIRALADSANVAVDVMIDISSQGTQIAERMGVRGTAAVGFGRVMAGMQAAGAPVMGGSGFMPGDKLSKEIFGKALTAEQGRLSANEIQAMTGSRMANMGISAQGQVQASQAAIQQLVMGPNSGLIGLGLSKGLLSITERGLVDEAGGLVGDRSSIASLTTRLTGKFGGSRRDMLDAARAFGSADLLTAIDAAPQENVVGLATQQLMEGFYKDTRYSEEEFGQFSAGAKFTKLQNYLTRQKRMGSVEANNTAVFALNQVNNVGAAKKSRLITEQQQAREAIRSKLYLTAMTPGEAIGGVLASGGGTIGGGIQALAASLGIDLGTEDGLRGLVTSLEGRTISGDPSKTAIFGDKQAEARKILMESKEGLGLEQMQSLAKLAGFQTTGENFGSFTKIWTPTILGLQSVVAGKDVAQKSKENLLAIGKTAGSTKGALEGLLGTKERKTIADQMNAQLKAAGIDRRVSEDEVSTLVAGYLRKEDIGTTEEAALRDILGERPDFKAIVRRSEAFKDIQETEKSRQVELVSGKEEGRDFLASLFGKDLEGFAIPGFEAGLDTKRRKKILDALGATTDESAEDLAAGALAAMGEGGSPSAGLVKFIQKKLGGKFGTPGAPGVLDAALALRATDTFQTALSDTGKGSVGSQIQQAVEDQKTAQEEASTRALGIMDSILQALLGGDGSPLSHLSKLGDIVRNTASKNEAGPIGQKTHGPPPGMGPSRGVIGLPLTVEDD